MANHRHRRLLGARRARPSDCRTADKCDELASSHRPAPQTEGLTLPCCGPHSASRQILAANVRFVPKADKVHRSIQRGYSITLSARASTVGGIERPSVLAVLKFTAKSKSTGCSTGMSAGL